ncbi:MAG: hypothetical protein ACM3XN_05545 [Chloroflexota bacterium]
MAHAYTPGLKVSEEAVITKRRRLPLLGQVLVNIGDEVEPTTIVARTELPGNPHTTNIANKLGVENEDVLHYCLKKPGDAVKKGEQVAKYKAFFGLMTREVTSPLDGVIESISTVTGQMVIREPAIPVTVSAYVKGKVVEIMDREGVVVETKAAFIQGIFGVGGETQGVVKMVAKTPDDILDAKDIPADGKGKIIVGGSLMTAAAIKRAVEVGAKGIVAGGIIDKDLIEFLGYDIGVAITGHEDIPLTIIVTEGFGKIRMADKTFALLTAVDGETASINGATQIRAGVMRPEIIVPGHKAKAKAIESHVEEGLVPGTPIRIIREPYFGMLATVTELPPELQIIETEAHVRIMKARLADGREVTVPRANVEIIEG